MRTQEHPRRVPPPRAPADGWRVAAPLLAVVAAFALLVVAATALDVLGAGEETTGAVLAAGTSGLLLLFGVLLWRRLPAHERRAATEPRGSRRRAVGVGILVGAGIVVGAGAIILAGIAVDPGLEDRLEDLEPIGGDPWHLGLGVFALVVLAPLGEELIFRGLLLRALVRRLSFWAAAGISSALFAAAHVDAYAVWPRAIALVLTGLVLAWIYRRRGFPAAVAAHATVNGVASVALVATA